MVSRLSHLSRFVSSGEGEMKDAERPVRRDRTTVSSILVFQATIESCELKRDGRVLHSKSY